MGDPLVIPVELPEGAEPVRCIATARAFSVAEGERRIGGLVASAVVEATGPDGPLVVEGTVELIVTDLRSEMLARRLAAGQPFFVATTAGREPVAAWRFPLDPYVRADLRHGFRWWREGGPYGRELVEQALELAGRLHDAGLRIARHQLRRAAA